MKGGEVERQEGSPIMDSLHRKAGQNTEGELLVSSLANVDS